MEYNVKNYTEQGGEVTHIGGKLVFDEGAEVEGFPLKSAAVSDSSAATVDALKEDFNGLLAALRVAGLVTTIPVTGITLNKTEETVAVEATASLTATVAPENATNAGIVWTSSDDETATVSDAGVVTGVKAGTVTITATAADGSGVSATCAVTVTAAS